MHRKTAEGMKAPNDAGLNRVRVPYGNPALHTIFTRKTLANTVLSMTEIFDVLARDQLNCGVWSKFSKETP